MDILEVQLHSYCILKITTNQTKYAVAFLVL